MKKTKSPSRKTSKTPVKKTAARVLTKPFPIVAFGASAGGLEAFSSVLTHLRPDLGMAYVLVMHLSPNHKSALAEILQSKSKMKVATVRNGMEVKVNTVFVIPPNTSMSIVDGHLKLAPRTISANGNFAIDYFFTALASVYKNHSIGVILSGTATDGTLGLKAIKAEGGITFAQDHSAKFPGMPKSAYESGYADFILSPEAIANELAQLAKIPYAVMPSSKVDKSHDKKLDADQAALKKILTLVMRKTGIDFFSHYKKASIYRRVIRRVALHKLATLEEYRTLLTQNEKEVDELYNDFLINVTNFFRDDDFYQKLVSHILPALVKTRKTEDPIRIWVAGCATGEEAYSISITVSEYLKKRNLAIPYQVFASDLDANAIDRARLGIYPVSSIHNLSPDRLEKFFRRTDGHYQVQKFIREACIFSQHNLLKDPPFSRIDLISCQNVLIYLENDAQQKILETFHYSLKPAGVLFLGKSESIGNAAELFESLDKKIRMYRRKPAPTRTVSVIPDFNDSAQPRRPVHLSGHPVNDLEREIGKAILTSYVMPCVVLNELLNIIQFFGVTSQYLSPVIGKASFNILKMVREDLLIDLRTLIQQAKKTDKPALKEGITIFNKKIPQELTLEVAPKKIANELFFLVVFKENPNTRPQKDAGKRRARTSDNQKE